MTQRDSLYPASRIAHCYGKNHTARAHSYCCPLCGVRVASK